MSERRSVLDAEMYKISEEDSQDEEVLSGRALGIGNYPDDVLKLGANSKTEFRSWNNIGKNDLVGKRWSKGVPDGNEYGDSLCLEGSSSFSAATIHHRLSGSGGSGGGLVDGKHYQHHHKSSQRDANNVSSTLPGKSKTLFLSGTTTSLHVNHHPDNVDWPETSSDSESYLSSEDRRLNKSRRRHGYCEAEQPHLNERVVTGAPAANNNKFVSKTYFGDHVRRLSAGTGDLFSIENELESHSRSNNLNNEQNHQQQQRKQLQKRSRRRVSSHGMQGSRGSSSGSDYSDATTDEEHHDDSCTDCVASNNRGRSGRRVDNEHHHRNRDDESGSYSDEGDYEDDESSYSESSYQDDDDDDDYDDYYDDDEESEIFHDMAKYLNDSEVEASTNTNGDLFFVEYSAESEISDGEHNSTQYQSQHQHNENSNSVVNMDDSEQNVCVEDNSSPGGARKGLGNLEEDRISHADSSRSVELKKERLLDGSEIAHFQKSGRGAKGKISRLLKRKKDKSSKMFKGGSESQSSIESQQSSSKTGGEFNNSESGPFSNSQSNQSKSPPSSLGSSMSVIKQKVQGAATTSSFVEATSSTSTTQLLTGSSSGKCNLVPEKVFRFKDEHGGEIRTVFVDVPLAARTGNLLGRRATLIESILGILPGRFSTPLPVTSTKHQQQQNSSNSNDRIMVAGFVPDGVASRYRRIKIGDWLQAVDDSSVDHANIDQVLSFRSMYGKRKTAFETEYLRLKLTLRRVAGCMVSLPAGETDSSQETFSCRNARSTTEMRWGAISPHVQSNVAVLFVSSAAGQNDCAIANHTVTASETNKDDNEIDSFTEVSSRPGDGSNSSSNNSPQKEKSKDVVYCWPNENESKLVKALTASQGMFSTLYRLLRDVTGSYPLMSKVVIDDCEMDVTYTSDDQGKSLLLVAVATTLSTFSIHHYQRTRKVAGSGGALGSNVDGSGSMSLSAGGSPTEGKKKEKKIRWREPQTGGITVSTRVMTRMESLFKYQFGSLSRAFKDTSTDEKVSRLLTNSICALNDLSEDFLFLQVPGNFLRFPNSIRSGIDDVLYSFETSDALFSNNAKSVSSRRSKDTTSSADVPVFHCHGSCLIYKGLLVTSHLENELASAFHGWWKTQLALWDGIKGNSLLHNREKPVSRLALWQQTCIPRMTTARSWHVTAASCSPNASSGNTTSSLLSSKQENMKGSGRLDTGTSQRTPSQDFYENEGDQEEDGGGNEGAMIGSHSTAPMDRQLTLSPLSSSPKFARSFSAVVGIGHFTLGFVLEHLTDYQGHVGPDVGWIRRAMATIGRLHQSGLTRSFESWLEKQGEREEFIELSGTGSSVSSSSSSIPSSKHNRHHLRSSTHQQEKSGMTSVQQQLSSTPLSPSSSSNKPSSAAMAGGASGSLAKKAQGTSSILKNTGTECKPCPVHFTSAGVGSSTSLSPFSTCTCSLRQIVPHSSSPFVPSGTKSFLSGTSSTFNSSSPTLSSQSPTGNSCTTIRPGIIGSGSMGSSMDDSTFSQNSETHSTHVDSDTVDGADDMDDTTTGTGSDNSSLKWYEYGEMSSTSGPSTTGQEVKFIRVSRGKVLFDYLQVEFGRGVMLFTNENHEGWVAVVRHNFRQSATVIHHILHKAANARSRLEERSYDKKWVSRALAPISEHGILFNCQVTEPRDLHKKKPRKRDVNYWVVGRIYPEEREIYICYEDGPMSQNLIEVAYKIALNVYC